MKTLLSIVLFAGLTMSAAATPLTPEQMAVRFETAANIADMHARFFPDSPVWMAYQQGRAEAFRNAAANVRTQMVARPAPPAKAARPLRQ